MQAGYAAVGSKYMDMRFILVISNICEGLFPKAEQVFSVRRRRLLRGNFKCHPYVYINSDLWNVFDESKLLKEIKVLDFKAKNIIFW